MFFIRKSIAWPPGLNPPTHALFALNFSVDFPSTSGVKGKLTGANSANQLSYIAPSKGISGSKHARGATLHVGWFSPTPNSDFI
jgi:hypothetical protein